MAILLEGKKVAEELQGNIKSEISALKKKCSKVPVLACVAIGESSASSVYIKSQAKVALNLGIEHRLIPLKKDISREDLIAKIKQLNHDDSVHGVIIASPLPKGVSIKELICLISEKKDAEGIHPKNLGRLLLGIDKIAPCTAKGCIELLKFYKIKLYGKDAVVVGHSEIVGKPLSLMLLNEFATTTVCHIATSEAHKLSEYVGRADILIVAVGKANLIKGEWVRQGAVVIDVGINKVGQGIVGDVEFAVARKRASYITPVPGGVGPLTTTMLMKNCLQLFKGYEEDSGYR